MSIGPGKPLTLKRIQQLADELRTAYEELVGGETVAAPAQIRAVVAEWSSDVLPAIDARIIRCHELVKRGLRDEAVGHALEEPDLFEAVKLLDLERFGRATYTSWMKAGQAAGLVGPVSPQLDKMADIEAARDQLVDLRPLLERWRRLNFQRAPLQSRIALLRELGKHDAAPQKHVWQTMLGDHESHRLMEIKAEIARLREQMSRERDADLERVEREAQQFLEELERDWDTLKPPPKLSDQARRLALEVKQRRVDATLDRLVPQLEEAYAGLATDRATAKETLRRLLKTWKAALADRGVVDPADPRLARVGPIIGYAELLGEHEALIAEVGHRVAERPVTLRSRIAWSDELSRMMDRIDDSATRLPTADVDPRRIGELSSRVADLADAVRREQGLRQFLSVAVVASLLVGIAFAAWSWYVLIQHLAEVKVALAECDDAVKRIERGEDVGDDLSNDWTTAVQRDTNVIAAIERVKDAKKKRTGTREMFAKQMETLSNTLTELQAAPRPDPLAPWPESFSRATTLLTGVRGPNIALTDADRAQLEQPGAMLRTKAKDYTAAADNAFEDRVRRIEADLATVAVMLADDPERAAAKLEETSAELTRLRSIAATAACPSAVEGYGSRKLVSDSVAEFVAADSKAANTLNGLRSRLELFAGLAARERQADRLLMEAKYAEYADFLRKIADDLGSGPVARDYNDVARNHATWQSLAEWRRFLESLVAPATLTAETAKALLEKLNSLSPEAKGLRDAKGAISWLKPALERVTESTPDKLEQLQSALTKILDGQHGEGVDGVVWTKDELPYPLYYCLLKDRPLAHQKKTIKYVSGRPDPQGNWPQKQLTFDPEIHDVTDSPQKLLALSCKKVMQSPPDGSAAVDRLAANVVMACAAGSPATGAGPNIDPCLQAILLRFLVKTACDGSPLLKKELAPLLTNVSAGTDARGKEIMLKGVDNEVFGAVLDPEKQDDGAWVRVNRERCAAFVKLAAREAEKAARFIDARELDVARRYKDLRHYQCVGRLRKLAEGGWAIGGGDPTARAGKQLFIAGGLRDDHRMLPCVECDAKGGIPPGSEVNGRAGEPVFIEIKSGKKG